MENFIKELKPGFGMERMPSGKCSAMAKSMGNFFLFRILRSK